MMMPSQSLNPAHAGSHYVNVGTTERVLSIMGGVALTYFGLQHFSTTRVLTALTGGALLFRGVTGYCPVNDTLGRDTAHAAHPHAPAAAQASYPEGDTP